MKKLSSIARKHKIFFLSIIIPGLFLAFLNGHTNIAKADTQCTGSTATCECYTYNGLINVLYSSACSSSESACDSACGKQGNGVVKYRYNANPIYPKNIGSSTTATASPIAATPNSTPTQFTYTLLESLPGFYSANTTMTDLPGLILAIYKFGIWTVGIAGLFMLVVGGIMYMSSAGNTSTASSAQGIITDALIGIVAALGAYLILYVINPDFTKINLNFTPVAVQDGVDFGGTDASYTASATSGGCIKPVNQMISEKNANWVYSPQPNSLRGQTVNGIRYTDCSDSVSAAYSAAGCFPVGNTTAAMYPIAQTFSSAAILKAGDLLVNIGQSPHVVMCMNDGCAQVIEAPGTGKPISIKGGSYFDSKTGDWANAKVIQAGSYCGSC